MMVRPQLSRGSVACLALAIGWGVLWAVSYWHGRTLMLGKEAYITLFPGWLQVWIPEDPVSLGGGWCLPGISWSHQQIVETLAYFYGVLSLHLAYPTGLFAGAGALLLWRKRGRYHGRGFPVELKVTGREGESDEDGLRIRTRPAGTP